MDYYTSFKLASYPIGVYILQYTGIKQEAVAILAVLFLIDIITAVIRQFIVNPHSLSSKTGTIGVLSKLLSLLIPITLALVGKGVGVDLKYLVDVSISVLIVYEGWSIISNIGQIRQKEVGNSEYDAISFLIKKIQDSLRNMLTSMVENKK